MEENLKHIMNNGAFIYKHSLFSASEISDLSVLADLYFASKKPVHSSEGSYGNLKWFQADFPRDSIYADRIYNALNVQCAELLVFYYLEPGAQLHPHRDLTGASLNSRIRFHVPIITNPDVEFVVSGDLIKMEPGDLWCLDTSYIHSVRNMGTATRVHIVIECAINQSIRSKMPSGLKRFAHNLWYMSILGVSLLRSLFINSYKNPKYFREQMSMIWRFLKWRILKIEKPK